MLFENVGVQSLIIFKVVGNCTWKWESKVIENENLLTLLQSLQLPLYIYINFSIIEVIVRESEVLILMLKSLSYVF